MSREYTTDEIKKLFLIHIWQKIDQHAETHPEHREILSQFAFSLLATLDGTSYGFPGFIVAPCPDVKDKEYLTKKGENYFPENDWKAVAGNISGSLHDDFKKYDMKKTI